MELIENIIQSISPGPTDNLKRPWYMHPGQDDNLLVLGTRYVDILIRSL